MPRKRPRQTAKYTGAMTAILKLDVPDKKVIELSWEQENLYSFLQDAGHFWNSDSKQWEYHPPEEADPPTKLVMVRVWAAADEVQAAALKVAATLQPWRLIEQSKPYPCRPPKQKEARVYLKFLPEG